jgi:hypothetical protein
VKRTPLRRISERRLLQNGYYLYRRKRFLDEHPYCQVWLREHGIAEEQALRNGGVVKWEGASVSVPLSTQIHHANKRRGMDLLDEANWLAVSAEYHGRIEGQKSWARDRGYLRPF